MSKRTQPKQSAPSVTPQLREQIVVQEREYKVITPLFGGGALAGQRDEVTIIRGTEIRGHLRFWWRACFGGQYKDVEEMKREENRIWGAASLAKKEEKTQAGEEKKKPEQTVQITVEMIHDGNAVEPFKFKPILEDVYDTRNPRKEYWSDEYQAGSEVPQYAAFMFQLSKDAKETEEEPEKKFVYEDVKFKLTISFAKELRTEKKIQQGEKIRKDIEGALWAWETFGGIGARTRRGFGALQLEKAEWIEYGGKRIPIENETPLATVKGVQGWLEKRFTYFGIEKKAPENIPSLSKEMLIEHAIYIIAMPSSSSATFVWNALIEKLRTFRQPAKGRNNQWLDTKEIKRLRKAPVASAQQPYMFPKAVLGLPIVFHFADKGKDADLTLQGAVKGRDRLASALILRPLACQNNYVGLALLLSNHAENATLPPGALQVVTKEQKPISATIDTNVTSFDTEDTVLRGETDVWKAFWQHLNKK